MKKLLIVLFAFSLISCGGNKETNDSDSTNKDSVEVTMHKEMYVEDGALGDIKIGMPIQELEEMFMQDQINVITESMEGMEYKVYELYFHEKSKLSAIVEPFEEEGEAVIYRINVYDEMCKTAEGIGAGSSVADIKETYVVDSWYGAENGDLFASVTDYMTIIFAIEQDEISIAPDDIVDESDVKDDWRIKNTSVKPIKLFPV
jgi:hypothetical protein